MIEFKNEIEILNTLSKIDIIIFSAIIFLTIFSVFYGQSLQKKDNEKEGFLDLLIMGRTLTLPMFVATLVATWYGGIFGVTEIAFKDGIYNFITQGLFWYIAYIIFALFLTNKISPYKALTMPDLIGKMFGQKSAKLSAIFNFFNVLPIAYTISLGIFLQVLFGGELVWNMLLGVSFVILYSMWGGLRAVVFSDLIQFLVMCISVFLVLYLSVSTFGGLDYLKDTLPQKHFSPTGRHGLAETLAWGFIALSTLVDPNFYQRCFAAKDQKVAKKGILISTFVWFLFDICTTFGAMYARSVIPEAESSGAYLTYTIQLLPEGLKGFFLAGILATILSTLDSYLFLAGTNLAYDLAPKKYKGKMMIHHIGVVFVGLLSVVMAIVFEGNIKSVWKTLGSYSASCLLLPVIFGYIFPRKIKDIHFVIICTTGVIFTTIWRMLDRQGIWAEIDSLYIGVITTTFATILTLIFDAKRLKN
ncbi:MAG: sodium:solute symporter family protein [Bdellovibrionota bacterium]|nr:sodium:solute symporter family protein [Bdellovibrionota bacterium]